MDDDSIKKYGICICSSLVFMVFILAISWDTVEPTEWGLKYNSLSKSIDNDTSLLLFYYSFHLLYYLIVYDGGRYLIWPLHSFIKFPRTIETVEFSSRKQAQGIHD